MRGHGDASFDEHHAGVEAHVHGDATVVLDEPVDGRVPEPALIRALYLAGETGPVFARAGTEDGRPVVAAWCAPWLAVERTVPDGRTRVRVWKTIAGLYPLVGRFELPRPDAQSIAGGDRPQEVADLLAAADEDGVGWGPGDSEPAQADTMRNPSDSRRLFRPAS